MSIQSRSIPHATATTGLQLHPAVLTRLSRWQSLFAQIEWIRHSVTQTVLVLSHRFQNSPKEIINKRFPISDSALLLWSCALLDNIFPHFTYAAVKWCMQDQVGRSENIHHAPNLREIQSLLNGEDNISLRKFDQCNNFINLLFNQIHQAPNMQNNKHKNNHNHIHSTTKS